MKVKKQQENIDKQKVDDIEYRLLQLNKAVSMMQQQLHEERRLLQSSRLAIGIVVMCTVILLGLAILNFSSSSQNLSSVIFHGSCLAGIGIVIALLCTFLPRSKKNR